MPRQDGTGPQGKGSQTGRRMGRCGPLEERHSNEAQIEDTFKEPSNEIPSSGQRRRIRHSRGW